MIDNKHKRFQSHPDDPISFQFKTGPKIDTFQDLDSFCLYCSDKRKMTDDPSRKSGKFWKKKQTNNELIFLYWSGMNKLISDRLNVFVYKG